MFGKKAEREIYCHKCGARLLKQGGEWTIGGKKYVMYYCPTAGPVAVDSDGWVKDPVNKGHYYELVKS